MKPLTQFLVGACLLLSYPGVASATLWQNGDVITYDQAVWGDPTTTAGSNLNTNYNSVYASTLGVVEIG